MELIIIYLNYILLGNTDTRIILRIVELLSNLGVKNIITDLVISSVDEYCIEFIERRY